MSSVATQSIVQYLEHVVVPDYIGRGVGGMFTQVPKYKDSMNGEYVHFLADDDILAKPNVCEKVWEFAEENDKPELIIVNVVKKGLKLPIGEVYPPTLTKVDLGCFITRGDVWRDHAHRYGHRYEGDYDFLNALYHDGIKFKQMDMLFMVGEKLEGAPEVAES
jgi:hypothetical protein